MNIRQPDRRSERPTLTSTSGTSSSPIIVFKTIATTAQAQAMMITGIALNPNTAMNNG